MSGIIIFLIIVGIFLYFLPSIIAFSRHKKNSGAIFALNFFLGWSLVGWAVSLAWALTYEEGRQKQ
jgi:hypothetical protein